MSKSIDRVAAAASTTGLEIEIRRMGKSTRTAHEAAQQCGCCVDQIVKSLIFQGSDTGNMMLFLVPGDRMLDTGKASSVAGEALVRADPRHIRERTGFAIGGVSPIGHICELACFADPALLQHDYVWAAAGAHDAVFKSEPSALLAAAKATIAGLT